MPQEGISSVVAKLSSQISTPDLNRTGRRSPSELVAVGGSRLQELGTSSLHEPYTRLARMGGLFSHFHSGLIKPKDPIKTLGKMFNALPQLTVTFLNRIGDPGAIKVFILIRGRGL
jgi:hypothetical protein